MAYTVKKMNTCKCIFLHDVCNNDGHSYFSKCWRFGLLKNGMGHAIHLYSLEILPNGILRTTLNLRARNFQDKVEALSSVLFLCHLKHVKWKYKCYMACNRCIGIHLYWFYTDIFCDDFIFSGATCWGI